jgi:hypothetical protein
MNKYRVHWELRKGGNHTSGTVEVQAESDFTAQKIAEGKVRSQNTNKSDYTFTVKSVERR